MVKNLPVNAEVTDSILGWEDLLEKEMATHFSILAWEIPRTEKPGGLQSIGSIDNNMRKIIWEFLYDGWR